MNTWFLFSALICLISALIIAKDQFDKRELQEKNRKLLSLNLDLNNESKNLMSVLEEYKDVIHRQQVLVESSRLGWQRTGGQALLSSTMIPAVNLPRVRHLVQKPVILTSLQMTRHEMPTVL